MRILIILLLFMVFGLVLFESQISRPLRNFLQENKDKDEQVIGGDAQSIVPQIVENALPSVVTISAKNNGAVIPFIDPNDGEVNIASGFVVGTDGLIITNAHVVADRELTYNVITNGEDEYVVESIYRDPLNDLAILKINTSGLDPLDLGNSDALRLGEPVVAIGTPLGEFTNSVTSGIISGLGRGIEAGSPLQGYVERLDDVIQTDAAISLGNSGGPLLNVQADVIGVNTAVAVGAENLGFAIPVNVVKDLLTRFRSRGESFAQPFIGIRYQMVERRTAIINEIPQGAYVHEVVENSPAFEAGIEEGDVITSFNGKEVITGSESNLTSLIASTEIGQRVLIEFWRNGQTIKRELIIGSTGE